MDSIKQEIQTLLEQADISLESTIDYQINGTSCTLSYRFIIDSYMQGSEAAKLVFITALKKSQQAGNMGIEKFFEGMGQLLLLTQNRD